MSVAFRAPCALNALSSAVALVILGGLAGAVVASGALLLSAAVVALHHGHTTRRGAAAGAAAYHLALSSPILTTDPYLATVDGTPAPLLWVIAALLQAAPWAWAWSPARVPWRTAAALVVSALPPLGLIAWAHPFNAVGLILPGTHVVGLALFTTIASGALTARRALSVGTLAIGVTHSAPVLVPALQAQPPRGWHALRTAWGDVFRSEPGAPSGGTLSPLDVLARVDEELAALQPAPAEQSPRVLVLPESVVPRWNPATELWWQDTIQRARSLNTTIIFGSTITLPNPTQPRLRNVAMIVGADHTEPVDQRIPVPGATWRPLEGAGVPLALLAPPTRVIADRRVSILLCYEQLLPWSYLRALADRPDLLLGLSNGYWVRDTAIPRMQSATLQSWAQLLGVTSLEATNR